MHFLPSYSLCFKNIETSNKNDKKNIISYETELEARILVKIQIDNLDRALFTTFFA